MSDLIQQQQNRFFSIRTGRDLLFPALLFFLLLFTGSQLRAQSDNLGIAVILGEKGAWTIEAPEGWRLDVGGARSAGLGAAFTPEGESWSKADNVMYGTNMPLDSDSQNVQTVIRDDSLRSVTGTPGARVIRQKPIDTFGGATAEICHVIRPDSLGCEAVAYIQGPQTVALVVLSARTADGFRHSLSSFARLVDSYEWVTSDPNYLQQLRKMR